MSRSPLRRLAASVRSVRFRLAMLVTIALIVTAGVLVLGMNLALDTVAATIPEEQPTTLEGELLRILDMSLAELDGSGEAGTDALLRVEQAVQEQTLQQVRNLSLAALLVLVPVGLAIGWVVAGRVVRPVGTIAGVAREIEATDLSRRIRLGGPPDEMRDLADTFDAMLDRLDRGVRTQRRFVEDASHELRNPLAVIRTTLDVALAEPEDAEGLRSAAEVARRTADRMSTTVDELMALARTSAQPEQTDIRRPGRGGGRGRPGVRRRGRDPWRPAVPARSVRPRRRRGPDRAEARPGEPRLERAPSGALRLGGPLPRRACRWMAVVRGPRCRTRDRARRPGPRLPPRLARRGSDRGGRRAGPGAGPRSPDRRGAWRHGQRGLGPRARRELRRVAAGPHGRCGGGPGEPSSVRWPTRSGRWTRPPDLDPFRSRLSPSRTPTLSAIS